MKSRTLLIIGLIFLLLAAVSCPLFSQESPNRYYQFPLSVGVKYQPLSTLAFVDRKASINELSLALTVPLPFAPVIQPYLFGGIILSDSDEKDEPTILGGSFEEGVSFPDYNEEDVWDYNYYFGALGISYSHRISKAFEIGAKGYFGLGVSDFQKRVITSAGEWYPVGEPGFLTCIEGEIALDPSFNF